VTNTDGLPRYIVNVINQESHPPQATLAPASEEDMTVWQCHWPNIWMQSDWDCDAIIKLQYQGIIQGLMRMALYPYGSANPEDDFQYIEIRNIESNPDKLIIPVGQWLIWYACKIALSNCSGDGNGYYLKLDSLLQAASYYRQKVKMDFIDTTNISPTEEGYVFGFKKEKAIKFCRELETRYQFPR
jgi:hypothetical protein